MVEMFGDFALEVVEMYLLSNALISDPSEVRERVMHDTLSLRQSVKF